MIEALRHASTRRVGTPVQLPRVETAERRLRLQGQSVKSSPDFG